MAQSGVTIKEIMTAVREFTFDRFIIPAFAIKAGSAMTVQVDKTWTPSDEQSTTTAPGRVLITVGTTQHSYPFSQYTTLEELLDALLDDGFVIAYTPYFRGSEPLTALITANVTLTAGGSTTLFRRYFFDDSDIMEVITRYYAVVLEIYDQTIDDTLVGKLVRPSEEHLALWVSYQILEQRRLYEQAAGAIGQSFTDGSDYVGSDLTQATGTTVTTQIGSVFSITEDPSKGYFYEDFNRIGSDNILGDRYSFWYKLQVWLRQQLEERFGDYSLRKDNVMMGHVELIRDVDFRAYFDSYPFTLSPLSRGIVSKVP